MKPRNSGERIESAEHATSALAAVLGHELNNIAVPLAGFAELALHAGPGESSAPVLDEIKIAVSRIKSLASDLESLGETGSRPMPIAIGECMPDESGTDPSLPGVDWRCSASIMVVVDPVHARHALQALAGVTGGSRAQFASLPGLRITQEVPGAVAPGASRCAACGATQPRRDHVVVQAFSSRAVPAEALRDPFGAVRVGRAGHRLGLAVLVHSTHCAGGHIFLDESAGSLSLAFPIA
jgi:hypothetical protein